MKLLIITLPFISSFFLYSFGRYIGYKGAKIISISSIIYCILVSGQSLYAYIQGYIYVIYIKEWFNIGILKTDLELIYDKESIIMNNLISIITFIVITYSFWYLSEDPHINRFISYLLIFSVSMCILVTSKNFLFTFIGWEGVGIISYLLINFWFSSPNNNKSSIKAVLFNKIGDIFYLFALILISISFYNFDINSLNFSQDLGSKTNNILKYIIFFFLIAAIAKSAQIFLHCWLGDAMAGPTPVSALLHAATMVTAGIYLIVRCNNLLVSLNNNEIYYLIIIIGLLTILFAGLSSLSQFDIKKVIAYSTCAQIGYMFFALFLYYPKNGSIFHLFTHGFFKALLFLSAGLLIHSLFNEQDLRKFGSFIFTSPLYYFYFLIGSFAIIAIPPFSGFFSKESILIHTLFSGNYFFFFFLFFGSLLSSLYSFKILFLSFFNSFPVHPPLNAEERFKLNNLFPFIILLFGSIFIGFLASSFFLSPENISLDLEFLISPPTLGRWENLFIFKNYRKLGIFLPFIALLFFTYKFNPLSNGFLSTTRRNIFSLFNRRFYFDSLYNFFLILPSFFLSYHIFYKFLDRGFLEFFGPLGFFRLFFFSPGFSTLSKNKSSFISKNFHFPKGSLFFQSTSNLPYLIYYLYFSFFFSFFFSFLFFST